MREILNTLRAPCTAHIIYAAQFTPLRTRTNVVISPLPCHVRSLHRLENCHAHIHVAQPCIFKSKRKHSSLQPAWESGDVKAEQLCCGATPVLNTCTFQASFTFQCGPNNLCLCLRRHMNDTRVLWNKSFMLCHYTNHLYCVCINNIM
jgi:hypothetical protein